MDEHERADQRPRRLPLLAAAALLLAVATLLPACGDGDRRAASPAGDPPPATGLDAPAAGELTPGGATAVPAATARHFDPGALQAGDSFLNLQVTSRDVVRVFDDSVWAGRVQFAGEITVTGEYRRHFDWPEPEELCFHVSAPASVQRIPAFAPDEWTSPNRQDWFCFTNPELALALLGPGEPPVRATIVVDEYTVLREFSDVFDTARLVDVVAVAGPLARPEPGQ
jgi:hypothetical protein